MRWQSPVYLKFLVHQQQIYRQICPRHYPKWHWHSRIISNQYIWWWKLFTEMRKPVCLWQRRPAYRNAGQNSYWTCFGAPYYLKEEHLSRGAQMKKRGIAKAFAMFSDQYTWQMLSKVVVERIYQAEVLSIRKSGTYMGARQIADVANVLNIPVRSVYPV